LQLDVATPVGESLYSLTTINHWVNIIITTWFQAMPYRHQHRRADRKRPNARILATERSASKRRPCSTCGLYFVRNILSTGLICLNWKKRRAEYCWS